MKKSGDERGRRRFIGMLGGLAAGTFISTLSSSFPGYATLVAGKEDPGAEEAPIPEPEPPPPVEERIAADVPRRLRDLSMQFSLEAQAETQKLGNGWHLAPYDPAGLLKVYSRIRLREGYRLASYQLVQGGNGSSFPFVIPASSSLPAIPRSGFAPGWRPPRDPAPGETSPYLPAWVRPDTEAFLDGDGSALSYLEASLFSREVRELGAMWHGISWGACKIVSALPAPGISAGRGQRLSPWRWLQPAPADWRPVVQTKASGEVAVIFQVFTRLRQVRIERHKDVFLQGYRFRTEVEVIAEAGPGFAF